MRGIQTFIPVIPAGLSHNDLEAYTFKSGGKTLAGIRKGDKLKAAESAILPFLGRAMPERPLSGKLRETVKLCYPTGGKHEQGEPMCKSPDLDNVVKVLNDLCQVAGWIADDARVFDMHMTKRWADPCGIFIRFEEVQAV